MKKLKLFRTFVLAILSLTLLNCSVEDGEDGVDGINGANGENGINGDSIFIDQLTSFGNVTANIRIFDELSTIDFFNEDTDMNFSFGSFSNVLKFDEQEQLFEADFNRADNIIGEKNINFDFEISQDFTTFTLTSFSFDFLLFVDEFNFFTIGESSSTTSSSGLLIDDINIINPVFDSTTNTLKFDYSFTREASIFSNFSNIQEQQITIQGSANVVLLIENGERSNFLL